MLVPQGVIIFQVPDDTQNSTEIQTQMMLTVDKVRQVASNSATSILYSIATCCAYCNLLLCGHFVKIHIYDTVTHIDGSDVALPDTGGGER